MEGVFLLKDCITNSDSLFITLKTQIKWDDSFISRKTASFGVPYNYSGINYRNSRIPSFIKSLFPFVLKNVGFTPNNCLINFYNSKNSSMGFHSDQIDILENDTGIVIISLGCARILRFKNKLDNTKHDIELPNGSFLYMDQYVQNNWVHSVLSTNNDEYERISITLRRIKINK